MHNIPFLKNNALPKEGDLAPLWDLSSWWFSRHPVAAQTSRSCFFADVSFPHSKCMKSLIGFDAILEDTVCAEARRGQPTNASNLESKSPAIQFAVSQPLTTTLTAGLSHLLRITAAKGILGGYGSLLACGLPTATFAPCNQRRKKFIVSACFPMIQTFAKRKNFGNELQEVKVNHLTESLPFPVSLRKGIQLKFEI